MNVRGQVVAHGHDLFAHPVRHRHGIGLGLAHHAQANGRFTVGAQHRIIVFHAQRHPGHIAQAQQVIALATHHQVLECLHGGQAIVRPNGEAAGFRFQLARRQFHVVAAQGLFDIGDGDLVGGHTLAIQPHAHGITALATDNHFRYPIEHGKTVHQGPFGKIGQLLGRQGAAGQGDPDNRPGIGIGLGDHRGFRFFRQPVEHPGYRIAHVVGGDIHIPLQGEFHRGTGRAQAAARFDLAHPFHPGNCPFDDLNDLGINNFRRGAGIIHTDGHFRRVDIRVFPDRQFHQRTDAKHHDQQADHRGKDRSLDGDIRQNHAAASVVAASSACESPDGSSTAGAGFNNTR